jgi:hypothetical protein
LGRIAFSPQRSRTFAAHQRHGSEQSPSRPRPLSFQAPPPTMQHMTPMHMKRSSIYVSDASILLSHKNPMLSPIKPDNTMSPTDETPDFIDHYASLELESNASIDSVRAAFRRLRGLYFSTDAVKYRAAQAAFDVLANPAARQDYDMLYRARPTAPIPFNLDLAMDTKHDRTDSAHGDEALSVLSEEEEAEAARGQDPNWALKRHRRLYEPVMGTLPYSSYIPILTMYDGLERHAVLGCRRPVYTGEIAMHARPN